MFIRYKVLSGLNQRNEALIIEFGAKEGVFERGRCVNVFSALKSLHQGSGKPVSLFFFSTTMSGETTVFQTFLKIVGGNPGRPRPGTSPRASRSGTLSPGQDECPGMELNVTGSQAGPSWRDKGLIRVQTDQWESSRWRLCSNAGDLGRPRRVGRRPRRTFSALTQKPQQVPLA